MVTMVIKYLGGYGNKSSLWLKIRGDGPSAIVIQLSDFWKICAMFFFFFQCVFGKNDGDLGLLGVHFHISPLQNSAHTLRCETCGSSSW